jgi:hypothetical protein
MLQLSKLYILGNCGINNAKKFFRVLDEIFLMGGHQV